MAWHRVKRIFRKSGGRRARLKITETFQPLTSSMLLPILAAAVMAFVLTWGLVGIIGWAGLALAGLAVVAASCAFDFFDADGLPPEANGRAPAEIRSSGRRSRRPRDFRQSGRVEPMPLDRLLILVRTTGFLLVAAGVNMAAMHQLAR